jgi:signal transduction histidine kinase
MTGTRQPKKRSLWLYYGISVVIVLTALLAVTWNVADRFRDFFIDHLESVLEARAHGIASDIREDGFSRQAFAAYCRSLEETDPDIRVTVIDESGIVLCDSDADPVRMDNHGSRPEVREALSGKRGSIIRYSRTVKADLLYVAVSLERPDDAAWVVRTALPLYSIDNLLHNVFANLLIVLFMLVASVFIGSIYVYRKINPPLEEIRRGAERFSQGRFGLKLPDYHIREISDLASALNQMAAQLDSLENLRREFVANVSHELKTPVTTIKGFIETLLEGAKDDPDDLQRFLEIISRQSDRLASIIDDLLTLSRLESAPISEIMDTGVHQLCDILESCRDICLARAQQKNITIRKNCATDIVVHADRSLLTQAIVNLVDNAIKYSPEETTVSVACTEQEGYIEISVTDEGPGIAQQHLSRLFERFYRADKARSRKLGGTGLGLAIVKHIVNVHGGMVGVSSKPGTGSTFTIRLPAGAASAQ